MEPEPVTAENHTRRNYLKYGSLALAGGLLAGCVGADGSGGGNGSANGSVSSNNEGSNTVRMAPVGEVTFDSPPEKWIANNGSWADMGVALGQEPPVGLWRPNRYYTHVYDDIPGLSVDWRTLTELWASSLSKEQFYRIGADAHVFDPEFVLDRSDWEESDLDEIRRSIGPIFGNSIYTRAFPWHDYRYYTLYEAFEKLAAVFDETERYRAFARLHERVIQNVTDRLPPASERPSVAILLVTSTTPEQFYPYPINKGTSYKQWRDLGVRSALTEAGVADYYQSGGTIGFETLLEVDPDALLMWEGSGQFERMSTQRFEETVVSFMSDHRIGSQLTAVENDAVFRGGGIYQGPIINLAWTERGARQLYPDEFGPDEQLYDRQRVADIVSGDF